MHKRDLALLVLCGLMLLASMGNQDGWSLSLVQYFPVDTSFYANHHFATEGERTPKPIITDLNGDGEKEVLIATREPKLYLVKPRDLASGPVSKLPILAQASLMSAVRVVTGRQPVAISVGYLDPEEDGTKREQVVVVVTHGWSVLLFDKNLKIVWETNLSDDIPSGFFHKETAIHISPHRIQTSDRGVVIVGGRMEYIKGDDYDWKSPRTSTNTSKISDDEMDDSSFDEEERHFSYFAFDGKTGKLRWKHEAKDFHEELIDDEVMYPQHNYKIHVKSHLKHVGETDWRNYKDYILKYLPYRWLKREDTAFHLAHFSKKRSSTEKCKTDPYRQMQKTSPRPEDAAKNVGVPPEALHDMGVSQVGAKEAEHKESTAPNVLVAVIQEGIEVIHLSSGRTLCQMRLMPAGTWADVNGDGIPEHIEGIIEALEASAPIQKRKYGHICNAVVTSGLPKTMHLFNGTICSTSSLRSFLVGSAAQPAHLETIPPLVIRRYDLKRSLSHLPVMDSVFYVSSGCITSYSGEGKLNWMKCDGPLFTTDHKRDESESNFLDKSLMPQLESYKLQSKVPIEAVIAVGDHEMAIYSQINGEKLVDVDLSEGPVAPIVVGDLNGDGYNDVILPTRQSYKIYYLERTPSSVLQRILIGVFILVVAANFISTLAQESAQNPRMSRLRRKLVVD